MMRRLFIFCWRPLTLARCFGVPVQLHLSTLVFPLGYFLWVCWDPEAPWELATALAFFVLLYGSLLVHEFAHVLTAWLFKCRTHRVVMLPFGCLALLEGLLCEPFEILMALAGPAASALLALFCWWGVHAIGYAYGNWWLLEIKMLLRMTGECNLMIAGFNLLPCFPMDGGRVFRSLLAILIGLIFPRRAGAAYLLATRIAVRCIAWPIGIGLLLGTCYCPARWHYLLPILFVVLLGELELLALKIVEGESGPLELKFLPAGGAEQNESALPGLEIVAAGGVNWEER
jgi:Zn-dependent protease